MKYVTSTPDAQWAERQARALDGHLISRCGDSFPLRTVLPLQESPVFRSAYSP